MPTDPPPNALRAARRALGGVQAGLPTVAGLLVVALIGLLDGGTDARLSFSFLYLLPVVACAWCGGFSQGVLVTGAGALAWHLVDLMENPALPPAFRAWNFAIRFGVLALAAWLASRLRVSILWERFLARTDALTGAANGRTFYEAAAAEAERSRRAGRPLTLAYLDLDDFKQLNDRQGHAAGDQALRCVVQTAQLHLRSSDVLARLGGDEFALLLPETGAEGSLALLGRLREALGRELARGGWAVTVSVGAVTFARPPADVDRMVQRVDALMYTAKRQGKARMEHEVADDDPDQPAADRRATARELCHRTARVRREGEDAGQGEFAAVRDICPDGIGMYLETQLPEDTLVVIEPLAPGMRTLLARVRHATPDAGGWRYGCELSTRLSVEELRFWTGAHAALADKAE